MSNSIAVWCEKVPAAESTGVECHFNLWRFADKKKKDIAEIGIMLDDPKLISCIKVFFPTTLKATDLSDCGPYFEKPDVAQGIFNEPLRCTKSSSSQKIVELEGDSSPFCDVFVFSKDGAIIDKDELNITNIAGGALIEITADALASLSSQGRNSSRGYFRIRIGLSGPQGNPFVKSRTPADRVWNSSVEQIEYVDFRLNEVRSLPPKIIDLMRRAPNGVANIKLIAFLTAVPVEAGVASSHEAWRKSRLLEHGVWKNYVPDEVPEGMVVYHWKKEPKDGADHIEDFSSFVKLQARRTGGSILWRFVTVAFLFGVAGNLTASLLEWGGPKAYCQVSAWLYDRDPVEDPAPGDTGAAAQKSETEEEDVK